MHIYKYISHVARALLEWAERLVHVHLYRRGGSTSIYTGGGVQRPSIPEGGFNIHLYRKEGSTSIYTGRGVQRPSIPEGGFNVHLYRRGQRPPIPEGGGVNIHLYRRGGSASTYTGRVNVNLCRRGFNVHLYRRGQRQPIPEGHGVTSQSINQNPQSATHEHKKCPIPAPPHGQQTLRREATQAWGAKSESRKRKLARLA